MGKAKALKRKNFSAKVMKPASLVVKATQSYVKPVPTKVSDNFQNGRREPMTISINNVEKATHGVIQTYEELNNVARALSEATMQSASAMTKGWDEITRSAGGMMQESVERTMSASKTMMSCKSMREAMEMQNEFIKTCFDSWMAGTGKLTEISARISKEVMEPVTQQVSSTMNKIMVKTRLAA